MYLLHIGFAQVQNYGIIILPSLITKANDKTITGFIVVELNPKLLKVLTAANHEQEVNPPPLLHQGVAGVSQLMLFEIFSRSHMK